MGAGYRGMRRGEEEAESMLLVAAVVMIATGWLVD